MIFGAEAAAGDLARALKYRDEILRVSEEKSVPAALIAALGSRETHWWERFFLGDVDRLTHQPHGHGPLQVDDGIRGCERGPNADWCIEWRTRWLAGDPTAVIDAIRKGVSILIQTHAEVATRIDPKAADFTHTVIAAYNCRLATVLRDRASGFGPDYHTTSSNPPKPGDPWRPGDYGADVLLRWRWFSENGFADPPLLDPPNAPPTNETWEAPTKETPIDQAWGDS